MMRQMLGVVMATMVLAASTAAWAQTPAATRTDSATAAKIHKALDGSTQMEFLETPLSEVVEFLSELHSIDVVLDERALEDVGLGTDTPVTISIKGVSLRSAMRVMLRDLELDYTIKYGALQLTTPEVTESQLINRVYPVADLLVAEGPMDDRYDYGTLTDAIHHTIAPDYWDEVGGPGSMKGLLGNLVVSQTMYNHRQVNAFLSTYRQVLKHAAADLTQPPKSASYEILPTTQGQRIRSQLDSQVSVEMIETPLSEAVEFLRESANIPIVVDSRSLNEVGLAPDTPITLRAKKARLRDVLGRMLEPLNLVYRIKDEVLQITTPEECEAELGVRFYPIYDMVDGEAEDRAIMMDDIIEVVMSTVAPHTWDPVGGPGSIVVLQPGFLVLSQTDSNHDEVATLLTTLRKQGVKPKVNSKKMTVQAYRILDTGQPGKFASTETVAELAKQLPMFVGDVNWREQGAYYQAIGSLLVVKHTRTSHRKTQDFLSSVGLHNNFTGPVPGVGQGGMGGGGFGGGGGGMFSLPNGSRIQRTPAK